MASIGRVLSLIAMTCHTIWWVEPTAEACRSHQACFSVCLGNKHRLHHWVNSILTPWEVDCLVKLFACWVILLSNRCYYGAYIGQTVFTDYERLSDAFLAIFEFLIASRWQSMSAITNVEVVDWAPRHFLCSESTFSRFFVTIQNVRHLL